MFKKSIIPVLVLMLLCLLISSSFASTALDWLDNQQNTVTGLIDSYEGDNSNVAYSYDQALAIMAFTGNNDLTRARNILDKMTAIQNTDGSWYFGYDATTGSGFSNLTFKDTGNNAWMIMAINYYTIKTGDTTYVNSAKKCADYLITLQDASSVNQTYGAVRGRPDASWYSTEQNHAAYSAFCHLGEILADNYYRDKGTLVYNWIVNKMWDNTAGRFYTGNNDYSKYLDPQSYAVSNLGIMGPANQYFSRCWPWVYDNMYVSTTFNGQSIEGFDYDSNKDGIWFEGNEQMSLAYEVGYSTSNAALLHSQTTKAQNTNGGIPCSTGSGTAWPTNMTNNSVAATSWYIFNSLSPKVNPFDPSIPQPDTTPPVISNIVSTIYAASNAKITWDTDEPSDSQVYYGTSTALGSSTALNTSWVRAHSLFLTGLSSGTTYYYQVRSRDASTNLAESSINIYVNPPADTIAPVITNVTVSGITLSSAVITWTTDEVSTTQVFYGTSTALGSSSTLDNYKVTSHTVSLTSLNSGTTYYYKVSSKDLFGNIGISPAYSFTTTPIDTTPPVISGVSYSGVTTNSAVINWTTNEASDSQVEYGLTTSYSSSTALNTSLILIHSQNLAALNSNTIYHYRVKSRDAAGNLAVSGDFTFTTLPVILTKAYSSTGVILTRGTTRSSYTALNANDSADYTVAAAKSGNTYYTDWYAKTVIAEAPANVTQLTITYDGSNSLTCSQQLSLYNFSSGTWTVINTQNIGTADVTITYNTPAMNFISSAGEIRLRVYASSRNKYNCNGDFIKFQVEYQGVSGSFAGAPANYAPAAPDGGQVKLYNNVFNPAKGESTRIDYTIDNDGQVTIKIYNITGELVRTLIDEDNVTGTYTTNWNGRNDDQEIVASGVYLCFVQASGIKIIKKIAVIK